MTDTVKFKLSAAFIDAHACLHIREIVYGHREGWIDSTAVTDLCLRKLEAGRASDLEEQIALTLREQADTVPELLSRVVLDRPPEVLGRVWCYLALAWVYENRAQLADPLDLVEMIYADFSYPDDLEGFVRYLPVLPGEQAGEAALLSRWASYLRDKKSYFRDCDRDY